MKKTLWVEGMSCSNCLRHLKSSFEEIGVEVLDAELTQGKLTIEFQGTLDDVALADVIEEAGYDFVKAENFQES